MQSTFKESIGVKELTDTMDAAKSRTCEELMKELLTKKADKGELSAEQAYLASILLQQDDWRKGAMLMLDMLLVKSVGPSPSLSQLGCFPNHDTRGAELVRTACGSASFPAVPSASWA